MVQPDPPLLELPRRLEKQLWLWSSESKLGLWLQLDRSRRKKRSTPHNRGVQQFCAQLCSLRPVSGGSDRVNDSQLLQHAEGVYLTEAKTNLPFFDLGNTNSCD